MKLSRYQEVIDRIADLERRDIRLGYEIAHARNDAVVWVLLHRRRRAIQARLHSARLRLASFPSLA